MGGGSATREGEWSRWRRCGGAMCDPRCLHPRLCSIQVQAVVRVGDKGRAHAPMALVTGLANQLRPTVIMSSATALLAIIAVIGWQAPRKMPGKCWTCLGRHTGGAGMRARARAQRPRSVTRAAHWCCCRLPVACVSPAAEAGMYTYRVVPLFVHNVRCHSTSTRMCQSWTGSAPTIDSTTTHQPTCCLVTSWRRHPH